MDKLFSDDKKKRKLVVILTALCRELRNTHKYEDSDYKYISPLLELSDKELSIEQHEELIDLVSAKIVQLEINQTNDYYSELAEKRHLTMEN